MQDQKIYSIPARFRKVENMHILLWLIKDACWAMNFRVLGVFMIVPTLTVALLITWQTRRVTAELMHNLAVDFWITANCMWMVGEFFQWDENLVGAWGLRQFALVPFAIGLLILGTYYIFLAPRKDFQERMFERTEELAEHEIHPEKPLH
jgi:hypothetical protein